MQTLVVANVLELRGALVDLVSVGRNNRSLTAFPQLSASIVDFVVVVAIKKHLVFDVDDAIIRAPTPSSFGPPHVWRVNHDKTQVALSVDLLLSLEAFPTSERVLNYG